MSVGRKIHQRLNSSRLLTDVKNHKRKSNCVFIPGCSLSFYSPQLIVKVLDFLKLYKTNIEVVLKCCGKPSKLANDKDRFLKVNNLMVREIQSLDAKEVIVACQNCYKILKEEFRDSDVEVKSLWKEIRDIGIPDEFKNKGIFSDINFNIQDSCGVKDEVTIMESVRFILKELGYKYTDIERSMERTVCCGRALEITDSDKAKIHIKRRVEEFTSDYILTYCCGCSEVLTSQGKNSVHILELIFLEAIDSNYNFNRNISFIKNYNNRYKCKRIFSKK